MAEVAQTVDQVVIINQGALSLRRACRPHRASRRHGPRRSREARRPRSGAARRGYRATERTNGTVRVHGVTADRIGEIALGANIALRQVVTESSTLEDVFLELTAEPKA